MTTSNTKEPVESNTETTEEQEDTISDRRLILAPLFMYGAVAFVIASVIVTTAILLNNEYNQIDKQVAEVEAELAQKNQGEQLAEKKAVESESNTMATSADTTEQVDNVIAPATETPEAVASNADTITAKSAVTGPPVTESPATAFPAETANATPVTTASSTTTSATVTATSQTTDEEFDPEKCITKRRAEHNEFLVKQDQKQLETLKISQAQQIERLRKQLARQQEKIVAIEKRNMETYEMREATIKRIQQAREQFLNRM